MSVLFNQVKLETRLFVRERHALFWTLAFPVFFIVLFGLVYSGTTWDGTAPINYILPGIVVMAVMTTGIMATTTGFVEEREQGIYRRLSLTPLKKQTLIGGQIASRYIIILVQAALLILIGVLFFDVSIGGNYLLFWGMLTLGALVFLAVGFALTGFIKGAKSANALAMIVFFFLMFLGGVFFPVEIMPRFLQHVCNVLPSTHLNDGLRMIGMERMGIDAVWSKFVILFGWLVGCMVISIKFFKWE